MKWLQRWMQGGKSLAAQGQAVAAGDEQMGRPGSPSEAWADIAHAAHASTCVLMLLDLPHHRVLWSNRDLAYAGIVGPDGVYQAPYTSAGSTAGGQDSNGLVTELLGDAATAKTALDAVLTRTVWCGTVRSLLADELIELQHGYQLPFTALDVVEEGRQGASAPCKPATPLRSTSQAAAHRLPPLYKLLCCTRPHVVSPTADTPQHAAEPDEHLPVGTPCSNTACRSAGVQATRSAAVSMTSAKSDAQVLQHSDSPEMPHVRVIAGLSAEEGPLAPAATQPEPVAASADDGYIQATPPRKHLAPSPAWGSKSVKVRWAAEVHDSAADPASGQLPASGPRSQKSLHRSISKGKHKALKGNSRPASDGADSCPHSDSDSVPLPTLDSGRDSDAASTSPARLPRRPSRPPGRCSSFAAFGGVSKGTHPPVQRVGRFGSTCMPSSSGVPSDLVVEKRSSSFLNHRQGSQDAPHEAERPSIHSLAPQRQLGPRTATMLHSLLGGGDSAGLPPAATHPNRSSLGSPPHSLLLKRSLTSSGGFLKKPLSHLPLEDEHVAAEHAAFDSGNLLDSKGIIIVGGRASDERSTGPRDKYDTTGSYALSPVLHAMTRKASVVSVGSAPSLTPRAASPTPPTAPSLPPVDAAEPAHSQHAEGVETAGGGTEVEVHEEDEGEEEWADSSMWDSMPTGHSNAAAQSVAEVTLRLVLKRTEGGGVRQLLLLVLQDISEKAVLDALIGQLVESQLSMVSQMFPYHVIQYLSRQVDQKRGPSQHGSVTTTGGTTWPLDPSAQPSGSVLPHSGGSLQSSVAQRHVDVTVLFMDIVGFTTMSKEVQPHQVMSYLNELFSTFDELVNVHGVHKVETAGDCYIVSAGVLEPGQDGFLHVKAQHDPATSAAQVMAFAKDMLQFSSSVLMPHNQQPTQIRIGIHTGTCMSGLVGSRLPKFSIYGDSINTASRMESTSIPGRIQVSEATHNLLPEETWEPTGGVQVKGKGMMTTYLWVAPAPEMRPSLLSIYATSVVSSMVNPHASAGNQLTSPTPGSPTSLDASLPNSSASAAHTMLYHMSSSDWLRTTPSRMSPGTPTALQQAGVRQVLHTPSLLGQQACKTAVPGTDGLLPKFSADGRELDSAVRWSPGPHQLRAAPASFSSRQAPCISFKSLSRASATGHALVGPADVSVVPVAMSTRAAVSPQAPMLANLQTLMMIKQHQSQQNNTSHHRVSAVLQPSPSAKVPPPPRPHRQRRASAIPAPPPNPAPAPAAACKRNSSSISNEFLDAFMPTHKHNGSSSGDVSGFLLNSHPVPPSSIAAYKKTSSGVMGGHVGGFLDSGQSPFVQNSDPGGVRAVVHNPLTS